MLYTQIAEGILKDMKKKKTENLAQYLDINETTKNAATVYSKDLDLNVTAPISQRKMIDLGKIVARVIIVNDLLELNDSGFSQNLQTTAYKW